MTSEPSDLQEPLVEGSEHQPSRISIQVDRIINGGDGVYQEPQADEDVPDGRYISEEHYSDRAPWLRAAVLGANDGLVSVSSIMLGVGGGSTDRRTLVLSGLSALVAGALSMAVGEYISVSSQEQTTAQGRAKELDELTQIYLDRGLEFALARQVAVALTREDVIRAHARDELGIDVDNYTSPVQAGVSSLLCFVMGAGVPLLGAVFFSDPMTRLLAVIVASTIALAIFGAIGAWLGGAKKIRASMRVLLGGWLAMALTYGVGRLFGESAA